MIICEFCNKEAKNKLSYAAHKRSCSANPNKVETNLKKHVEQNGAWNKGKTTLIPKACPVCKSEFRPKNKKQTTCSHSCSNLHTPRLGPISFYRTICFRNHEKKCVICDEANIVEVHHYDENHSNNDPANLVPLCPTHHQYWHSKFKHLISDKVDTYIKIFINSKEPELCLKN